MVPGPSHIPDRVMRAMHRQSVDHRSLDFPNITRSVLESLKDLFVTKTGRPFIFPATGTGAWESGLSNTLSPGDRVITVRLGQFSHLWIDMMERLGLDVVVFDVVWGEGLPTEKIRERLVRDPTVKAVCVVQNETTTGVLTDIAAVSRVIDETGRRDSCLLLVDGVSSIGSSPFFMDDWKVDVAITGSQKGLMLPAGLGLVCASQKALKWSQSATLPRVFFSWKDMIDNNEDGYFPYTPSTPLLYGLREALDMIAEEGLENVWARHRRFAEGVRRAVGAWNMRVCATNPAEYSDTVTTIMLPEGFNGVELCKIAYQKYNLSLGGGLMKLRGKAFRIGTLGDVNELIILGTLAGTEMALRDIGVPIEMGSGVSAAAEFYRRTAKPSRGFSSVQAKI